MKKISLDKWPSFFDLVILDLWGVLSDGFSLYKHALPFLGHLREQRLKVVLLSNTPFRTLDLQQRLGKMGLGPEYYEELITAGEVTRILLQNGEMGEIGKNYYYVGPEETAYLLDGLNFHKVKEIQEADFLLVTGYPNNEPSLNQIRDILLEALLKKMTLLCPNPDKSITLMNNQVQYCAGMIARDYEWLGGKVYYVGKPFSAIYEQVLKRYPIAPDRILAIGDVLETDIAGAQRMGFKSLLVSKENMDMHLIQPDWQWKVLSPEC